MMGRRSPLVVNSREMVRILRLLGWHDFRVRWPEGKPRRYSKRRRYGPLRVNGIPWSLARLVILYQANNMGIDLHPGQLRDVAYLLGCGRLDPNTGEWRGGE